VSDPFGDRPFPRGALAGAALLVVFALIAAAVGRLSGIGTVRLASPAPVAVLELRFEDRADGGVAVYAARDGRLVDVLAPGTNGFARGALRGLARDRKRQGIGAEPPFRLTRWADGRLSLEDPATGRRIDLEAFGPTNAAAFARLMSTAT